MLWRMIAIKLAVLMSISGAVMADTLVIGYVSTLNDRVQRPMIEAIKQRLDAQGIEYDLKKIDPAATQEHPKIRLLLTLGQSAAQESVARYAHIPILSLIIRKQRCIALRNGRKRGTGFSCIQLEQPPERLAYFTSRLFPGRVEALFFIGEQAGYRKAALVQAFAQEKIALRCEDADVVQDLRRLRLKLPLAGVLVTSPDPTVYSATNLQGVILNAYQAGVPILGFSDAFRRAGAAASLFTTAAQFGRQAAEWVIGWKGGAHHASQVLEPEYFDIGVNKTVMRAMSLSIPDLDQLKRDYIQQKQPRD